MRDETSIRAYLVQLNRELGEINVQQTHFERLLSLAEQYGANNLHAEAEAFSREAKAALLVKCSFYEEPVAGNTAFSTISGAIAALEWCLKESDRTCS